MPQNKSHRLSLNPTSSSVCSLCTRRKLPATTLAEFHFSPRIRRWLIFSCARTTTSLTAASSAAALQTRPNFMHDFFERDARQTIDSFMNFSALFTSHRRGPRCVWVMRRSHHPRLCCSEFAALPYTPSSLKSVSETDTPEQFVNDPSETPTPNP